MRRKWCSCGSSFITIYYATEITTPKVESVKVVITLRVFGYYSTSISSDGYISYSYSSITTTLERTQTHTHP